MLRNGTILLLCLLFARRADSQTFNLTNGKCISGMIFSKSLIENKNDRHIGFCQHGTAKYQCKTPANTKTKNCLSVETVDGTSSKTVIFSNLSPLRFTRFSAKVLFCQPTNVLTTNVGTVDVSYTTEGDPPGNHTLTTCSNLNGSSTSTTSIKYCQITILSTYNLSSITVTYTKGTGTNQHFKDVTLVDPIFCTDDAIPKDYHAQVTLRNFGNWANSDTAPAQTHTLRCFVDGFVGCEKSDGNTLPLRRIPGFQDPQSYFSVSNPVYSYELGSQGAYLMKKHDPPQCENADTNPTELTVGAITDTSVFADMSYYFMCVCKISGCPTVQSWEGTNANLKPLCLTETENMNGYWFRSTSKADLEVHIFLKSVTQNMNMWTANT